jgi:hypothetical protein
MVSTVLFCTAETKRFAAKVSYHTACYFEHDFPRILFPILETAFQR